MIHFVNTTRSTTKTSNEQEWGQPSAQQLNDDLYCQPLQISTVFKNKKDTNKVVPARKLEYEELMDINCPLLTVVAVENFKKDDLIIRNLLNSVVTKAVDLCNQEDSYSCSALLYILAKETEQVYTSRVKLSNPDYICFYESNVRLSEKEIISICAWTHA